MLFNQTMLAIDPDASAASRPTLRSSCSSSSSNDRKCRCGKRVCVADSAAAASKHANDGHSTIRRRHSTDGSVSTKSKRSTGKKIRSFFKSAHWDPKSSYVSAGRPRSGGVGAAVSGRLRIGAVCEDCRRSEAGRDKKKAEDRDAGAVEEDEGASNARVQSPAERPVSHVRQASESHVSVASELRLRMGLIPVCSSLSKSTASKKDDAQWKLDSRMKVGRTFTRHGSHSFRRGDTMRRRSQGISSAMWSPQNQTKYSGNSITTRDDDLSTDDGEFALQMNEESLVETTAAGAGDFFAGLGCIAPQPVTEKSDVAGGARFTFDGLSIVPSCDDSQADMFRYGSGSGLSDDDDVNADGCDDDNEAHRGPNGCEQVIVADLHRLKIGEGGQVRAYNRPAATETGSGYPSLDKTNNSSLTLSTSSSSSVAANGDAARKLTGALGASHKVVGITDRSNVDAGSADPTTTSMGGIRTMSEEADTSIELIWEKSGCVAGD